MRICKLFKRLCQLKTKGALFFMMFSVQKVTIFYDVQQDRLHLLFVDNDEQVLLGAMTRRLLNTLLIALPDWLAKNIKQGYTHQNEAEQHEISQFNHQAAQQNVRAVHGDIEIDKAVAPFMVETINLANQQRDEDGVKVDHIKLSFIDAAKSHHVVLAVSSAQLHKLIGEMLTNVDGWGLGNPWAVASVGAASMLH